MKQEEVLQSEFCDHFKEVRNDLKISTTKLSGESKVDKADISKLEHCEANPTLKKLLKLVHGLGCVLRIVPKEGK
jgi:predicted transcriptional regulator